MKLPVPRGIRQLVLLVRETVTLRQVLLNRVVILFMMILLVGGGLQGYIALNNDGRISGTVVGPNGEPVSDANVTMRPIGAESVGSSQTTLTNSDGQFVFSNQTTVLQFEIYANKAGLGRSPAKRTHLYFRGQNTHTTLEITNTTNAA